MKQHALLSPSAAHRWLNCTAAPMLEKDVPDKSSTYAEEGTLAHAYCAKKLKEFLGLSTKDEEAEIAQYESKYHTGEMDEYTDTYATIVLEKFNKARAKTKDAQLLVEVPLNLSHYIPDAFGTSDAVIIADGTMEIIDFKYGKGVKVEADHNPQMMIYAIGAWDLFNFEYRIDNVKMTIVQPRIDNLSEFEMTAPDLGKWVIDTLEPKAKEAYSGNGSQAPGQWCQFCKVKSSCKALAEKCVSTVKDNPVTKLIGKETMEQVILPLLPTIKTWLTGVEEYSLEQALSGVHYEGYKIVEGISRRKITDPAKVMKLLHDEGFEATAYMKPTELKGITDLEKLLGKKKFNTLCADYIDKPQGKPTLVPESDKRPVFNAAANDFDGINIE